MKTTLYITLIFIGFNCFGQINSEKVSGLKTTNTNVSSENDTIIKVVYKNKIEDKKNPAFFINGKFTNDGLLKTINANDIANIKVEKENFEYDNVEYFGKILIETKDSYKPKLISLNDLRLKHTNIRENSVIFLIDEDIINADYDKYLIDENYILSIVVEKFEKENEKLNINFIKLVTKTEENIKKSKEIRIRGNYEFEK